MSEIYIDNNCKVCSSYGNWINKKNNNLKLYNQKNLSENEIMLDTLVFKKEENVYYFSYLSTFHMMNILCNCYL